MRMKLFLFALCCLGPANCLPALPADWLLNPAPFAAKATVSADGRELELNNGLVKRALRLKPGTATVALDNLATGESVLRSVGPEAIVELNGLRFNVGGLVGQPVHNFLKPAWGDSMRNNPAAWQCTSFKMAKTEARFAWKPRREWMSSEPVWPPPGVRVTFEYGATPEALEAVEPMENVQREVLLEEPFTKLSANWRIYTSPNSPRSSFQNEGRAGEIVALENTTAYAECDLPAGVKLVQCRVEPGTDKSASWGPGLALIWPHRVVKFYLRPGKGILGVTDNGAEAELNAIEPGQAYWLQAQLLPGTLRFNFSLDGKQWKTARAITLEQPLGDPVAVRLGKTSRSGGKDDYPERGNLGRCRIQSFTAFGKALAGKSHPALADVKVRVHYELYDGLPLIAKWLSIQNKSAEAVTLNNFIVEQLAVVEPESIVDGTPANFRSEFRALEAFSDYSFGGNMSGNADAPAVRWKTDPLYDTQVHYERKTPCLLEGAPPMGPEAVIKPGETFESFRVFELLHDSTDRERRGLAVRRAYRVLAPWIQENPILMHVRSARPDAVRAAVDQCAEVGFEMVIMTFGSGFDIENEKPEYLSQIKGLADYAHSKGIALGGYSLLASRSINAANDVICPGGARFGSSPCIGSRWGQDYFRKLQQFFEQTGCAVLEHDGSYPGDFCSSTNHPGHVGLKDSQWAQWKVISDFYKWCRARGIYLNVPDWYYLAGSTKCGMGYRETNWSLPRDEQEIIERQNVYDGTWEKAPSMGWMFVPLTEYHGGGPSATIEPLKDHLEHYEARLADLFGAGVQACYRGPRLYDSDATKAVVKKWVSFYKQHRPILDSDVIHLRRPDGRDWDGLLHVNPNLPERGLAMFYNPLATEIQRAIKLPLYYTGLAEQALITREDGSTEKVALARDYSAAVSVKLPAKGRTWIVISEATRN